MPTSPSSETGSHSDTASPPDTAGLHDEKPYHAKRPHKKSRSGCKSCKARKVKCDETRPTCRSCRLRKTECVYPAAPTTTATSSITTSTSPSTSATSHTVTDEIPVEVISRSSPSPLSPASTGAASPGPFKPTDMVVVSEPMFRPSPAVDETDMRLLWFYTTATCSSFSVECGADRPVENIMRTKLVQHAFETPFLMDSLFALSTLHLQNLGQDVDAGRALIYRAKSFEGYRRAVEEGRPETFPGLMANSLLLTALSSQNFRDPEGKELYIVDWMIVWRGIGLMIHMMGIDALKKSGLESIFYRPPMNLEFSAQAIPNNLLFMISSISPGDIDFREMETYYNTLKYLGTLYHNLRQNGVDPIMKLRIITWFTFIPRRFVELGREKRPRVLVILAYYAMFLKLATSVWWISGIGQRTLLDISRHLGLDWADFLRIPLHAITLDKQLELSRHILEDPTWESPELATEYALDDFTQGCINSLTWVDNIGRKVTINENKMILVDRSTNKEPVWSL